ncbi:sirohydrochlorin chelatase [Devosia sp.]|uniref:sirohydrochlorin chelatase n=1 Tax=Devosia sp. TaxID=1871048 RepID=UPI003A8CA565
MTELPILPDGTGIMLCGHGSRNQRAVGEFAVLSERLRERLPGVPVEYGYLEFANPVLHHGLDKLREQGVTRVLAVPGMLFAAGHAKNDIPSVLNTYAAAHPGLTITYGRELGVDLKMLRAAGDRIAAAVDAASPDVPRSETLLVVVGRGASDPDANSNVAKVMRMLWEGMGFGWGEVAYSGVTFPLVAPALDHVARMGYRRVVVFPYFLFTGVLVNRIRDAVAEARVKYPSIEFLDASYLNDHPMVIDTFIDRVREILVGENLMNCALCKYREQVLGFEAEVGMAQESHHHHVEGIGGGLENCPCGGDCDSSCRDEAFCKKHGLPWTPIHSHAPADEPAHSHDHGHDHHHHHHGHDHDHDHPHDHDHAHDHAHGDDHHHHPYPHADHPLGPVTLPKVPGRLARAERKS